MDARCVRRRMEHGSILKVGTDMADMFNFFARSLDSNFVCRAMLAYGMLMGLVRKKQVMPGRRWHEGDHGHGEDAEQHAQLSHIC